MAAFSWFSEVDGLTPRCVLAHKEEILQNITDLMVYADQNCTYCELFEFCNSILPSYKLIYS